MYEGWLRLGGREVVNMARLMAYVENGVAPAGVSIDDCTGTCEGFAEALTEGGYTTPRVDQPEWFDAGNPDSLEFAGFMPTEMTGIMGSQATRGMLAKIGEGSLPGKVVRTGREIGVTGVLVGSSNCGVQYGLSWLERLLVGACDDDCLGRPLHMLTCCPTPACDGVTDPLGSLVAETYPHDSGDWIARRGVFTEATGEFRVDAGESPQVVNRNRLVNPAVSGDIDGWLAGAYTTIEYAATPTWAGQGSIAATMNATSGNINVNVPASDRFDVTAGEHLAVMNHVQGADVERRARLGLWTADASGTSLGTQYLPWTQVPVATDPDVFTELAGVVQVPEGAVKGSLITIAETPVTGETWHVDGGLVAAAEQATDGSWIVPAYFDGDTVDPTRVYRYAWEGERNNSASVKILRVQDSSTETADVPLEVAFDSFMRGSFSQPGPTGHVWETLAGTWVNTNGEEDGAAEVAAVPADAPGWAVATWGVATPWQRYSGSIPPLTGDLAAAVRGLAWGVADAANLNYVVITQYGVRVGQVVAGVDTPIADYAAAVTGVVGLEVESRPADPDAVTIRVNGVDIAALTVTGGSVRAVGIVGDTVGAQVAEVELVDVIPNQPVPQPGVSAWVAGPVQPAYDTGARITWDVRLFDQVTLGDDLMVNGDFEDPAAVTYGPTLVVNGDAETTSTVTDPDTGETTTVLDHWSSSSPTGLPPVQDTTVFHGGAASAASTDGSRLRVGAFETTLTDEETGETSTVVVPDESVVVEPGVEYAADGWVRTDVAARVNVGVEFYTSEGAVIGDALSMTLDTEAETWAEADSEAMTLPIIAPEGAAFASLLAEPIVTGAEGEVPVGQLWADDLSLVQVFRSTDIEGWTGFVPDPQGRSCTGTVAALVAAESWDEQDPAILWDTVDAAVTWDTYGSDPLVSEPIAVDAGGVYRVTWSTSTVDEWDPVTQESPPILVQGQAADGSWTTLATATPPAGASCVEQSVTVAMPAGHTALRVVFEARSIGYLIDSVSVQPQQGVNLPLWVLPALVDPETGQVVRTADAPSLVDSTTSELVVWDLLGQNLSSQWRPALLVPYPGLWVESVTIEHFPLLSPQDCVDQYLRVYPDVVLTSGPTVTEVQITDCGVELMTVEWVWTAGNPYRYGWSRQVVADATNDVDAGDPAVGSGVQVVYDGVIGSAAWDCDTPTTPESCAVDPGNPGMTDPPRPVLIADPNRVVIDSDPVESIRAFIPATQVGDAESVFTFRLHNDDHDKVGVRVRVYDDVNANGIVDSICAFTAEYQIDYLGPGYTLTLDGVSGAMTVDCPDGDEDASSVIHGAFGGPVVPAVASCGRNYMVLVQWLDTYPKSVAGYYTAGEDTGGLTFDVLLSEREG